MKIKMLTRHTAPSGRKLEKGLVYEYPENYAQGLIDYGLAIPVFEIVPPVEAVVAVPPPGFVNTQRIPPQPRTQFFAKGKTKKAKEDAKP